MTTFCFAFSFVQNRTWKVFLVKENNFVLKHDENKVYENIWRKYIFLWVFLFVVVMIYAFVFQLASLYDFPIQPSQKNAQHETKSQYSAETWPVFHFFKHQWTIQKCNNFTTFRVSTRFHVEELLAFHTNYSDTHSRSLMISSTTLKWSKLSINFVHETKIVINLRVQNKKYE